MPEFQELDWRFEFNDRGTHSGNYLDKLNQLVIGFNTTINAYNAQLLAETDAQAQQALAEQFRNEALTFRNQAEAIALGNIQGTNLDLASCRVGGVSVALIDGLIANATNATNATNADNSDKLGNQLPAYYGKQSDITALNAIVFSDDAALNEIQEIVDYIKLNRSDLDALSIASIAGLVAALDGKVNARSRVNYEGVTNDNVVGQLGWSAYGNSHTIFDASKGVTPAGTSCDKSNSANPWTANYPTLMGFNGTHTYGVRVDSAKKSDLSVDSTKLSNLLLHGGRNNEANKVVRTDGNGYANFGWINTPSGNTTSVTASYFVDTGDGYIRKKTLAQVRAEINPVIQGSNSNGKYVKFPDGTLICYTAVASNGTDSSTTFTYPHAFLAASNPVASAQAGNSKISNAFPDSNGINYYAWGQNLAGAYIVTPVKIMTIGRWK